jgi:zinc transport system substrate-binding protein
VRSAVAALLLLAAPTAAQDRPVIVADSYPMAYFAERLAGDGVEVRLAVPEGRDPASWRPSLDEIARIQAADLIVLNGAGLADWTTRVSLPRARTVETARAIAGALIATGTVTHSHGAEGEHSHAGSATHTWLDLDLALVQALALAAALERMLPGSGPAAKAALLADLAALDAAGEALVDGPPVPAIATHARYEYLGAAYGLRIASLDWDRGAVPDDAMLAELERLTVETGARLLIWQEEPPHEARAAVAALGLAQAVVPPLAMPPEGADFVQAMQAGLASLASALGTDG